VSTHRFSPEFKEEAIRQVVERGYGVAVAQAARDLDLHENVLRKWIDHAGSDMRRITKISASIGPASVCTVSPRSGAYAAPNHKLGGA